MGESIFAGKTGKEILDHIRAEMHQPGHVISKFFFTNVMAFMIWGFVRCGIHPTVLTSIKIVLSVSAAFFMVFAANYWWALSAAVCVYFSMCLDGVDGCVARLTGKTSAFGAWLDNLAENGAFIIYFFGAALYWHKNDTVEWPWIMLAVVVSLRYMQQLAMRSAVTHFSNDNSQTQVFNEVGNILGKFRISLNFFIFGNCMQSLFVIFFVLLVRFDLMLYFFALLYGGLLGATFLQACVKGLKNS